MTATRTHDRSALGLAAVMATAGIAHFVVPDFFRRIIPSPLRGHDDLLVAASGVAELVCAAMVASPRTRKVGGWATVALLIGVFPANVQHALDDGGAVWLRLPLQLPLVMWAHRQTRE
jgi:uncharacterized membrane protein